MTPSTPIECRAQLWLRGTLPILAGALLSCAQPHEQPAAAALPAAASESHLTVGDTATPVGSLRNPHAGDAAVAHNGALLFIAMNCDGCHGGDATGWVGPNLGDRRWRYGGADAEVFNSIYFGRPRGMPAFGGTLGVEGVWTLVTYLRSLSPPPDIPTESWQN
jgi:cytochrome c oxidase cbb3-type subunit 3